MPRKSATTREAMIEGAFQLIREHGAEALTARSLAARLGCSTQPIMYQFPALDELRDLAYRRADEFHTRYILAGESLLDIGMRYISFAAEEPRLFQFLFQSGRFAGLRLGDMMSSPDIAELLQSVSAELGGARDPAALFEPLFAAVHGYASLIANNAIKYDPEAIGNTLIRLAQGLLTEDSEQ